VFPLGSTPSTLWKKLQKLATKMKNRSREVMFVASPWALAPDSPDYLGRALYFIQLSLIRVLRLLIDVGIFWILVPGTSIGRFW